jgi:hypothetical protein
MNIYILSVLSPTLNINYQHHVLRYYANVILHQTSVFLKL